MGVVLISDLKRTSAGFLETFSLQYSTHQGACFGVACPDPITYHT